MENCLVDDSNNLKKLEVNVWDLFNEYNKKENEDQLENDYDMYEENIDDELQDDYGCESCKTYTLVYQDGQHVCSNCGLIQHKKLSQDAEYRNYGVSDNKSANPERVGMPTNYMLPESSLGTFITQRTYDKQHIKRMVQYNTWSQMPYRERSLYKTCCEISNKGKMNGLPTVITERAKEFYNTIRDVNISRGDNRDGLIAACIYFACKDECVPRSKKEIADVYKIDLKDMTIGIKNFRTNWRLSKKYGDKLKIECSNPIDFIERYCSHLPVSSNIKHIAEFIAIKSIFKNLVDDNTAPSIAAGAIFLACYVTEQHITKKQVADACKTSEVTISKCYKKLNEKKVDLLPKEIIKTYKIQ